MDIGSGLSSFGNSVGSGLAAAMEDYHKQHVQYDQASGIADALSKVGIDPSGNLVAIQPDANGKTDKSIMPVIDPKAVQLYQTNLAQGRARATGSLEALSRVGIDLLQKRKAVEKDASPQFIQGPDGSTIYKWGNRTGVIKQPGTGTNPDLNYVHAVNAHAAQVNQIEDYFKNNYGVGPNDILNSNAHKGYVYDKATNDWKDAQKDQTPDAIGINTGTGFKWLGKDQFESLKPQAKAWEDLQQNPPQRKDYQRTAAAAPISTNSQGLVGQANAIKTAYQAGQITREEAAKQIGALNIPGLK